MKKRIFAAFLASISAIILVTFSGCTKGKDGVPNVAGGYYVKFKVDGNETKYTYVAGSINGLSGGQYGGGVGGYGSEIIMDKNSLLVTFSMSSPAVANTTYTNYQTSMPGNQRATICAISLRNANGSFFASWGDEFAGQGVISDTKVKFTEINTSSLRGTFSGTLYKEINGNSEKHTITDGEFFVLR